MSSSGSSVRSYTWVQFKMRSPSGSASKISRGWPPVAISTASAVSVSSEPSAAVTTTLREPSIACLPTSRAAAAHHPGSRPG